MPGMDAMDSALRLKFEAAIQDHVAKKATNKRLKAKAREQAEHLRERAQLIEAARAFLADDPPIVRNGR